MDFAGQFDWSAAFHAWANGFPTAIIHLIAAAAIYIAGLYVYVKLTPHKEIALIQDGNIAAAISFGALVIGLAIPISVCLRTAMSVPDIIMPGVTTLVLQLFLFRVTDMVLKGLPSRIEDGEIAAAVTLGAFKIAGSLALGAALGDMVLM